MKVFLLCLFAAPSVCAAALAVNVSELPESDSRVMDGNDFAALASVANKIGVKSEFESKAEYLERLRRDAGRLRAGNVRLDGTLALRVGRATSDTYESVAPYEYDADREMLRMCLPYAGTRHISTLEDISFAARPVRVAEKITPRGSYVGRNAFNVAVRVRRQDLVAVDVMVAVSSFGAHCSEQISMPAAVAKRLLPTAVAIIIGRLEPPYVSISDTFDEATIQNPIEERATVGEMPFRAEQLLLVSPSAGVIYRQAAPPTKGR